MDGARSSELSQDSSAVLDSIPRMTLDHILIDPLPSIVSPLAFIEKIKPIRGTIVAVGPGTHPKVYFDADGRRTQDKRLRRSFKYSRHFLRTQVKPGDVVEIGGREYGGYAFPTVMIAGKKHVICRELDVSGILDA